MSKPILVGCDPVSADHAPSTSASRPRFTGAPLIFASVSRREGAAAGEPRGQAGSKAHFCVGRTRDGVAVVGANVGFTWSFVAEHCVRPVLPRDPGRAVVARRPELLAAAVVRVVKRQPHAITAIVPDGEIWLAPPQGRAV